MRAMVGKKYRHFKGGVYTLIAIGNDCDTRQKKAIYRDERGTVWVRPLAEFEGVHPSGVLRFVQEDLKVSAAFCDFFAKVGHVMRKK